MERKTPTELAAAMYAGSQGVIPGSKWVHIKTGNEYVVLACMLMASDLSVMVAYGPMASEELGLGITWTRPCDDFRSKFRRVT